MRKAKTPEPVEKEKTLGELIDQLEDIREKRRPLDAESKRLKEEYDEIAAKVIEMLETQKSDGQKTKRASVSISESVVPILKDADAFAKWAVRTNNVHLFTSSCISVPAWREQIVILSRVNSTNELLAMSKDEKLAKKLKLPPGTEYFQKKTLTHSSLKGA